MLRREEMGPVSRDKMDPKFNVIVNILHKQEPESPINRLFAYCKGGNFKIHIWAWFSYFICETREIRFYL